jgi:sulfur-oxidizing protein SoxY
MNQARRSPVAGSGLSTRRQVLVGSASAAVLSVAPRSAWPADEAWRAALMRLTGGRVPSSGRVRLDLPVLVENGNAVPVTLSVDSPMSATDHVRRLALLTERNPQPEVAVFTLSPLSGRGQVATRMRLATSQTVWALAEMGDGSWWQQGVDVVVTLAACVEGEVT